MTKLGMYVSWHQYRSSLSFGSGSLLADEIMPPGLIVTKFGMCLDITNVQVKIKFVSDSGIHSCPPVSGHRHKRIYLALYLPNFVVCC